MQMSASASQARRVLYHLEDSWIIANVRMLCVAALAPGEHHQPVWRHPDQVAGALRQLRSFPVVSDRFLVVLPGCSCY